MKIIDQITHPGTESRPNEDAMGHNGNTAWILDGAGSVAGAQALIAKENSSDAAWFSHFISQSLQTHAPRFGPKIGALLNHAVDEALTHFKTHALRMPGSILEAPLATLIVLHHSGNRLQALSLSDSILLVETPEGIKGLYGDEPHRKIDNDEIAKAMTVKKQLGLKLHQLRNEPSLRSPGSRAIVNTKDGYWALSLSHEPLNHVKKLDVAVSAGAHALLATDGLYRLVDMFGIYDDASLLEAAKTRGLQSLCDELRQIEDADPEADRYPRIKKCDDATALLLRF